MLKCYNHKLRVVIEEVSVFKVKTKTSVRAEVGNMNMVRVRV